MITRKIYLMRRSPARLQTSLTRLPRKVGHNDQLLTQDHQAPLICELRSIVCRLEGLPPQLRTPMSVRSLTGRRLPPGRDFQRERRSRIRR